MPTTRISTDHPDLGPVLGPLDDEERARVAELLAGADARLTALHEALEKQTGTPWDAAIVVLETSPSGQASIDAQLEEETGKLTFSAQLRPRNYFPTEEAMWQPGRPPLQMATDAWDVEGGVDVRYRTRVAGRPYTIQERVHEIEERRYESALEAVEAFVATCDELVSLAGSREASVEAWRPPEEAAEGASAG